MSARHDDHLELACRHIVEGEIRVTRQLLVITRLQEQGHDTAEAETLLAQFEQGFVLMREHLRILQAEDDAR
ncbi:hypothetical protein [Methylorubrum extorquens]|uniref:hypothetical protein n=1 Tax=Methylorubrum extorquens TaxID=408 RepID=UPI00059D5EE9|nr:hypothetical protein [Methylorubrum extorquens]